VSIVGNEEGQAYRNARRAASSQRATSKLDDVAGYPKRTLTSREAAEYICRLLPNPIVSEAILNALDARAIAVGSTNPVKIGAVRAVLGPLAPHATIGGVAVASTVPDQPVGDDETIRGAIARAHAALLAMGAELGVGIEGGIVNEPDGGMRTCAWAAVVDAKGRSGVGGSLAMALPPRVAEMIREGMELGHAMDALTGAHDTKRGAGAVGILTAGLVDRQRAYEVLVSYAIARFVRPELYETALTDATPRRR
jgi:inosine/xanthosine triphosphatase